jgi:hypothetical protein
MTALIDSEILTIEHRLTEATRELNIDELDRVFAADIMFTGVTGAICDKVSVMDEARRGLLERQKAASGGTPVVVGYEKEDIRAIRHGKTAVTSFQFGVTIRSDGKEVVRRYRTTNVWMKRDGDWQIVTAHTAALG